MDINNINEANAAALEKIKSLEQDKISMRESGKAIIKSEMERTEQIIALRDGQYILSSAMKKIAGITEGNDVAVTMSAEEMRALARSAMNEFLAHALPT